MRVARWLALGIPLTLAVALDASGATLLSIPVYLIYRDVRKAVG